MYTNLALALPPCGRYPRIQIRLRSFLLAAHNTADVFARLKVKNPQRHYPRRRLTERFLIARRARLATPLAKSAACLSRAKKK